MVHVLGVSMPRSGHHIFEMILKNSFEGEFAYCEFYETNCCRKIPCTSITHSKFQRNGLFLQKSHDFNFKDPLTAFGVYRLVQYRSPVPRSLSNYELHLRNGAKDTIQTFRNFLVNEAIYFYKFYKKWIALRSSNFFFLTYEKLIADPLDAVLAFLRFIQIEQDAERISDGIARSIGWRGRDNKPFVAADVSSHRYAQYPVLANFEDIVVRNCPGYFPVRYFSVTDSENSLIGVMFNAMKAIDSEDRDLAISLTEAAYVQDADNLFLAKLREAARTIPPKPAHARKRPRRASSSPLRRADRPSDAAGGVRLGEIEIVMLTYNEEDMLPYSVPALTNYFKNFLFLDMESTDRTLQIIKDLLGDQARVIPYKREGLLASGYAHARNFAAQHCTKPWLLMVDADEVLTGGVTSNEVAIDAGDDATSIVTIDLRILQSKEWQIGQPLVSSQFQIEKTVSGKKRLYRPEHACWRGYIHEELFPLAAGDSCNAKSHLVLDHLTSFRRPGRVGLKRQMYSWMLLRVYKEITLRDGVNPFWYDEYVPKYLQQIEADAQTFAARYGMPLTGL